MKDNLKIMWIDFVRLFAICCVVLCHSVEKGIYTFDLDNMLSIRLSSRIFAFFCFTVGRLGVPLFLLITGYLLLDRNYDSLHTKKFWKKNWLHLMICTLIWFLIYEFFLCIYCHKPFNFFVIVKDLLFIHEVDMIHVWYMPMILGMYVLIPFVANSFKTISNHLIKFPIIIFIICSFMFPLLRAIAKIRNPNSSLSLQFSLGFSGGAYGLYLIFGYLVKQGMFKKIRSSVLMLTSFIFFLLAVLLQLWAYSNHYDYNIWYDNFLLLVTTVSLFELISRMKRVNGYNLIKIIAKYSFSIYLLHAIFRSIFLPYVKALPYISPIKVVLLWSGSMVVSLVIAIMLGKVPKIGKYLLYLH